MGKIVTKARQLRLSHQLKVGRDVSVQEVADAVGITRAALSRIERGLTTNIDFATLKKLCEFYGVGVGDILEYDPNDIRWRDLVGAVQTT